MVLNTIWVSNACQLVALWGMESLHSNYSDTTDSDYSETFVPFAQPVKWLWQQKSIYRDCIYIVDYAMISKRLSDNIRKTTRDVSVKISSHDASFTSNHFKFHFLWRTYSLVSDAWFYILRHRSICKDC